MDLTIVLPRVVGTRMSARSFLERLPVDLAGEDVVLDCSGLLDGTASFADEVVKVVLRDRGARALVVDGAGDDFAADLLQAARDHGVENRFSFRQDRAAAAS